MLLTQKYVYKIHSARLRKAKWNLILPLAEARKNEEVIAVGDSQLFRFIAELNQTENQEANVKEIRREIRQINKQPNTLNNRQKIKQLYERLDAIQYEQDYLALVIDTAKDYWRACKGFTVNGTGYVRLLGTSGGIKDSTIIFVSERLAPELRKRIDNGRNKEKELIPAKLEAYQGLVCSGSTPVSLPKGIAVVNDCITQFCSDVLCINDEQEEEPVIELIKNANITLNDSDGYGLILPTLAKRWSEELQLGYVSSGFNTRFAWEKGMVFPFDFLEFADRVAGTRIIHDAWGNEVDLSEVELILTTSMLKLWDSYESCEHYLNCCQENHYTFAITKVCPATLEKERNLNYQFIQSYELTEEQIEELIAPTIQEIHEIIRLDWRKAALYLTGTELREDQLTHIQNNLAKAILIEPSMFQDSLIQKTIYHSIKKRINDAKIGVIKVHGNYSVISGDPYSLCQSMFGLPITGLLQAGEIYNKYWLDNETERVVCFRAPMTCHNNIRLLNIGKSREMQHWYQYMTTCTILNSWDTTTQALNGADKDGDIVLLTDNKVLLENTRELPAIFCVQRKGRTCIPSEKDMIQANIDSFGDDIGKITNRITAMFEAIYPYPKDSKEYQILSYRIKCGQLFQQNAIDKAKGIVAKPMPKIWYDEFSITKDERLTPEQKKLNHMIVAGKKPYFMRYIYPRLQKQYRTYLTNTNKKALREFKVSVTELLQQEEETLTEAERQFIYYYYHRMPVGIHPCVMNQICKRFEEEFDHYLVKYKPKDDFDYQIMKSGQGYSLKQYQKILTIYQNYQRLIGAFMQFARKERLDAEVKKAERYMMVAEFQKECQSVCSNQSQLCDIVLDICYQKEGSKQFAWDIAQEEIIHNLFKQNQYQMFYPVKDHNGDVEFHGERFSFVRKKMGGEFVDHYTE